MPDSCVIRVLVVDNNPSTRSQVVEILEGIPCKVMAAEGLGVELGESAKELARIFKPHVVIMDLRLVDEHADDRSGLELWKDSSFSSARCILYSAYLIEDYRITKEALKEDRVEDVVGKEDAPQALVDAVVRVARMGCGCKNGLSLNWPSIWNDETIIGYLYEDVENIPRDLVLDVFGRLFPDTKSLVLKALEGVAHSSIVVAHGRAVLFQVWPDDREPVVVKLAPRKRILREVEAYENFIQDRLVGRYSANLHKYSVFWDLGGICYSFMGSSQQSMETFTSFYKGTETSNQIIRPLEHFFEEVWKRHYTDSRKPIAGKLYDAYDPFQKLHQRLEAFSNQEKTIIFPSLPGEYLNPVVWVLAHKADSYFPHAHQAITHGDLHGDNLFVDDIHAWAIDFERSGPGHILRDFVELEQNIITRLLVLPEDDLRLFHDVVMILTKPVFSSEIIVIPECFEDSKEIKKALEVIKELRSIAKKVTRYEDMREYYWGLLLDTCFGLMLAETNSPRWQRRLLLASILCTRLKGWGRIWPPEDWPKVDEGQINQSTYQPVIGAGSQLQRNGTGGNVTHIYVGGNFDGNLVIGNANQALRDSYNKISSADMQFELKETLKLLAEAVAAMNRELSEEKAADVIEDLSRLVDEVTKPIPNRKWYSVSVDGLIEAAEKLDKLGEPVISLSKKVLSLLIR